MVSFEKMMLTAGDDELTSYGSACIALFFVFIALGLVAGYITQVLLSGTTVFILTFIYRSKKSVESVVYHAFKTCHVCRAFQIRSPIQKTHLRLPKIK